MKYIPSVAFSLCDHSEDADFEPMRPLVQRMTERVLKEGLPRGVCLNVNFPVIEAGSEKQEASAYRGVKVCRMARGRWVNETVKCHNQRGYDYWWMAGNYVSDEADAEDTDRWALAHGYVAITPTRIDVTAYEMMEQLKTWE